MASILSSVFGTLDVILLGLECSSFGRDSWGNSLFKMIINKTDKSIAENVDKVLDEYCVENNVSYLTTVTLAHNIISLIFSYKSLSYAEGREDEAVKCHEHDLAKLIEECGDGDLTLERSYIGLKTIWIVIFARIGMADIPEGLKKAEGPTPQEAVKNLLAALKEKKV